MAYLRYIVRGLVGAQWQVDGIDLVHGLKIDCRARVDAAANSRIFVEADGELLGTLPAAISIVPDALALLFRVGRTILSDAFDLELLSFARNSNPVELTIFPDQKSRSKASDRSVRPTRLARALQ